ncbi:glycosyltransferase family 2 protein [Billgrantia kenyensis]|uniref:Glycosyltransferase family 2 protein n=1 Tax=Billgrantia kenyensis TaxID=321266 RepID=A0A7V9W377_9GAMM|nr:glycosyltransferase family 2 protein [Halomonas kenyensis]MBA2780247.1 glycosyltransferase family 2 protein [Halomonas kenyensis]MCG6663097.1 glycosyltransferase family 2 protein [Halomonas kenyensis]
MMAQTRVTTILTVYNEEVLVTRAISSIFNQTLRDIELLIIDDGSNDNTPAVLASIKDSRLRVIRGQRMGRAQALKMACEEARGEYIANIDADDIAYPERLSRQMEFLDSHPDHAWVGCGEERRDTRRNEHIVRVYPVDDMEVRRQSAKCIPYTHSGIMFRRALIENGINYDPSQPYLIDFEFFLRVARHHKVANLPDILTCRYVRDESFFQSRFKTSRQNWRLICLNIRAIHWFGLPLYFAIYPVARVIYPYLPNAVKRGVRSRFGLEESSGI